ncbi:hypothetical protein AX16_003642 [Volvariella volvacea WC 439]|nr:hypothetical protein AX16_003642 [Volvariella volvacea WC 439]
MTMLTTEQRSSQSAVTVYCGSSLGRHPAYRNAAISLGEAIARAGRRLVYGGGSKGLMGIVSDAALRNGAAVTGIVPFAMVRSGGEKEQVGSAVKIMLDEKGRDKVETIIVDSMHERKVEMARRSGAFVGLPGGYGTFEEVFEVITWTQLGIHSKPVILLNVLSYYEPLRQLVQAGVDEGFIKRENQGLVIFVNGPENHDEHETFNWGEAALEAIENWKPDAHAMFDWAVQRNGVMAKDGLSAS